ncbi:MAG: hypothetical protein JWN61_2722 [Pseudonocardiales bacterium]|nr:hypothetical protein [Pseudonocardiales bacterium]
MPSPDPRPGRREHRNPRSLAARAAAAQNDRGPDLRRSAVLLAGTGVVLVALALAVLPWYDSAAGSSIVGGTYRDLRDVETLAQLYGLRAPLVLRLYFGWLPAVLLVASIAAVGATAGPPSMRRTARVLAPLLGLAALIATCWALQNLWDRVGGRAGFSIAGDSRIGMWAALLGFALLGLAGAIGLRRR